MLLEALAALGFFAAAVPFGYLSRTVKQSAMPAVKKWPTFLGLVHAPVVPLIIFVKLEDVAIEFELLLVGLVLLGHLAGVLLHRQRSVLAARAAARAPAPAEK